MKSSKTTQKSPEMCDENPESKKHPTNHPETQTERNGKSKKLTGEKEKIIESSIESTVNTKP
jgi:hypothetical protein